MEAITTPWLIEGLWQFGKINVVAGYEKSGKSRLLCWCLAGLQQSQVLGLSVLSRPQKILWLAGEETIPDLNNRLTQYSKLQGTVLPSIEFINAAGMRLDLRQYREWMENEVLVAEGFDMLVIDPFRRVHEAKENDSDEMGLINTAFRKWSNKHNKTICIVHHTAKVNEDETDMDRISNWVRGSTDIGAIVDTAIYVKRAEPTGLVVKRAGRFPPLAPIKVYDYGDMKGFVRAFEREKN